MLLQLKKCVYKINEIISGVRLRNFGVRVGADSEDLGNKPICYEQQSSVLDGATRNFSCAKELYGNWVSVNKSSIDETDVLQLREVRVYGMHGEYGLRDQDQYCRDAMSQCTRARANQELKSWGG